MVFGEMNAGTVTCANTPATLMRLPHNAHKRTAAYVDDHAQGSSTFAELLQGYRDFLALCQEENWTLNATKTRVGYPSCVFFGFEVERYLAGRQELGPHPPHGTPQQLTGTAKYPRRFCTVRPFHPALRAYHRRPAHRPDAIFRQQACSLRLG